MATFVVIPPRECLESALAEFAARVLPGVAVSPAVAEAFVAALEFEANRADDAYFVHREDLPGGTDTAGGLVDGFGAEAGDRVIEIGTAAGGRPAAVRRGRVLRVSGVPAGF